MHPVNPLANMTSQDNGDMVVHESADVSQEQGSDDGNTTPSDTGQVDIFV